MLKRTLISEDKSQDLGCWRGVEVETNLEKSYSLPKVTKFINRRPRIKTQFNSRTCIKGYIYLF